jgi:hypothetical protein
LWRGGLTVLAKNPVVHKIKIEGENIRAKTRPSSLPDVEKALRLWFSKFCTLAACSNALFAISFLPLHYNCFKYLDFSCRFVEPMREYKIVVLGSGGVGKSGKFFNNSLFCADIF